MVNSFSCKGEQVDLQQARSYYTETLQSAEWAEASVPSASFRSDCVKLPGFLLLFIFFK